MCILSPWTFRSWRGGLSVTNKTYTLTQLLSLLPRLCLQCCSYCARFRSNENSIAIFNLTNFWLYYNSIIYAVMNILKHFSTDSVIDCTSLRNPKLNLQLRVICIFCSIDQRRYQSTVYRFNFILLIFVVSAGYQSYNYYSAISDNQRTKYKI